MSPIDQTFDSAPHDRNRVDWVDFSKGLCIILVVLMHSAHGVEKALGVESWLHGFVEWARPFRMPDFFLIAGLFLSRRIDRPWRSYLDTKVLHFAYFYVIWMTVWYVLKLPDFISQQGLESALWLYLLSFVQPLGTLWFIYLLAVFFITAKLFRQVPVVVVWSVAALLHALHVQTGIRVVDEFAARFVFFYSGYVFAPYVFAIADAIGKQKTAAIINGLVVWSVINAWLVFGGWSLTSGIELAMGYVGTVAVIAVGVLLARYRFGHFIAYCGRNSILIFLSYFIFMAGTRIVLLKVGIVSDPGLLSLIVTTAGVVGPLVAFQLVKNTPLVYLYRRHPAVTLASPKPVRQNGEIKHI